MASRSSTRWADFEKGSRSREAAEKKLSPVAETLRLLAEGRTLDEIAGIRGRQRSTIVSMVSDLVERGEVEISTGLGGSGKAGIILKVPAGVSVWASLLRSRMPCRRKSHSMTFGSSLLASGNTGTILKKDSPGTGSVNPER